MTANPCSFLILFNMHASDTSNFDLLGSVKMLWNVGDWRSCIIRMSSCSNQQGNPIDVENVLAVCKSWLISATHFNNFFDIALFLQSVKFSTTLVSSINCRPKLLWNSQIFGWHEDLQQRMQSWSVWQLWKFQTRFSDLLECRWLEANGVWISWGDVVLTKQW